MKKHRCNSKDIQIGRDRNFVDKADPFDLFFVNSAIVGETLPIGGTQKIKQMLMSCDDVTENSQKLALLGSLTLYLDFLNLFLYLLRIFGRRE